MTTTRTHARPSFEVVQVLIKRGDIIALRKLLAEGLDPNLRHKFGSTILMVAAGYGRTDVVRLLLAKGARVNDVDSHGNSSLALAALGGHCATVAALLGAGASVRVSPHGVSLLRFADWGGGASKTRRHFDILRSAGAS